MQKTLTKKESDLREPLYTLHNAHIFTWYRHHPLDPAESLFITAQEGSLLAHHQLIDLFLCYVRQQAIIPPGVLEYAICTLDHQARLYRVEFKSWKHNQNGRKSAAGRPSLKALGDIRAQSLEALSNSLQFNLVDTQLNRDALQIVGDLNEKLRQKLDKHKKAGIRLPRAFPGSHRNHAQAFENAMNVWEYLQADSTLTEKTAIRWVAEDHHKWRGEDRGGQTPPGESQQAGDRRGNAISGLARTIDRHFYLLKPHLKKWGFPPLEFVLDD
ncbi:hypothetical protein [Rhodoferax antarcticus]|uniref:hypothetical protein n=1 Tax=Rhodoferax antarcticus TaxID=81479 RepID=UPI0022251542|nr:hypothetical protein [Rhodoferax antarcticus]MCW2313990.1 hypothetical protein [Rhodoferax antarcticus]